MHYKTKYTLALLALAVSMNVSAFSWPYSEEVLLENVTVAHTALNDRTEFCMDFRKLQLPKVKSDWLYSLPEKKRKGILIVVDMIAMERCTEKENADYSMAVIRYSAETQNNKYLNDWMSLSNYRFHHELFKELSDIPPKKIIDLSERPEFYMPFNSIASARLIVPEDK